MLDNIKNFIIQIDKNYFILSAFAILSRAVLLLIGFLVLAEYERGEYWQSFLEGALHQLNKADVVWYQGIAFHGYTHKIFYMATGYENWAFYPLWPILLNLLSFLPMSVDSYGLLLSNILFLVSICLLYKLIKLDFDTKVAFYTCLFFLIFPYSYYYSRAGTESLFMCLTLGSLLLARNKYWLFAGIAGALSTITRVQGLIIFFPLAFIYFKQFQKNKKFDFNVLSLLLMPVSLLSFMLHLYSKTGNFFASFEVQKFWYNLPSFPFHGMINYIKNPCLYAHGWELSLLTFFFMCLFVVLFVVMVFKANDWSIPLEYIIYTLLHMYVNVSRNNLMAGNRYLATIFPVMIVFAIFCKNRPNLFLFLNFIFVSLLTLFSTAVLNGKTWAMP